jgi:amino acid adenylation domain-containing protein
MAEPSQYRAVSESLADRELLTGSNKQEIGTGNGRGRVYPRDKSVPQLVAAQAAATPDAVAVVAGDRRLTYGELNTRSNQFAWHLRSLGVGSDVVVAFCLKPSIASIVGALGILKAGGAYLPLDPAYPTDRLAFLLNDARVPVLVTAQCIKDQLPMGLWKVVGLDAEGGHATGQPQERPVLDLRPENLAYVIYTSGSTGQPKGVEITHGSLLNLVFWHQHAFAVTPADRASHLAGVGFDAAVWELWPYLTAGASVHLPDESIRYEPEALRDWLVAQQIKIAFVPTPMAERMMTLKWPSQTALRVMLTGADVLHRYPSPKLPFLLVNNYGPTECTVVATSGPVLPYKRRNRLPTIGRPIANVQIYILDEKQRQVPVGTSGELYIGGAGLARGYRNRPDLTAERFLRNPFSKEPGARLYRTGDLAKYLPDGQIAFLGRVDDQTKIRGYRIEPNEIVALLDEHPTVQESVVVAREFAPGDKRLVAYVVLFPKATATRSGLHSFLRARLPDYMVPATFVQVDALPLNCSGKVDRAALPAPEAANTLRDDSFVAARTPTEQKLTEILAPLLGLDQVSVEDNFFMLGGHSLLAAQVVARVRDAFRVELTLRSLFDHPTVEGISAGIERLVLAKLEAMSEDEVQRALSNTALPGTCEGHA